MNLDTPIELRLEKVCHIPSFKNSKMWTGKKLITNPKRQEWMERAIQLIVYGLCLKYQTIVVVTQTEQSLQSWIASHMPWDDSVDWIPEITVSVQRVQKGEEGALITIERIS